MTVTLDDIFLAAAQQQAEVRDDPTMIPHLYVDKGMSIAQIARIAGMSRSGVYSRLLRCGVYKGRGKSGPPRLVVCQEGHDMDKWGVEKTKEQGGGRFCRLCKRKRDRATYRRRMERLKAA